MAIKLVKSFKLRKALLFDVLGPIIGAGHAEGPRCNQPSKLDVAGADAEITAILADAAALHGRSDHDGGKERGGTIVDAAQNKRLRAAARGSGHADSRRIDFRQTEQEVEGANTVPRLQAHEARQPEFVVGVLETF